MAPWEQEIHTQKIYVLEVLEVAAPLEFYSFLTTIVEK